MRGSTSWPCHNPKSLNPSVEFTLSLPVPSTGRIDFIDTIGIYCRILDHMLFMNPHVHSLNAQSSVHILKTNQLLNTRGSCSTAI
ncbi:hypothetical protein DCAR_0729046 [Daucus carota subsp. sativus]|uniref:Uncharacterized protein n=1 Tax=Daucus carota subsp. sativus TaxID=79200 RepID=A0A164TZR8_DAUCS|nr:hypothetical protein DCAR_0729046 [Daucus carota subsp. sativus]